ncbi:MAG: alpha/beta hydrolase [Thermoanaerobaculia bacterium]
MRLRPSSLQLLLLAVLLPAAGCVSMRPYAEAVRGLPEGRLIEVDGRRISVERAGEGPPLVLLHGFGESTLAYAAVLPELAKQFAVVAIDLNGFGFTERPKDRASYSLAGQERLVLAVLDRLHLDRVRLAGHSYGGGLALYLAARHPERIDRLLLIDNTLPLYASQRRSRLFRWRWVAQMAAHTFALTDRVIRSGLRQAYYDDSKVTPALVRDYADRLRIEGATDAFFGLVGPSVEPPFRIDLATVAIPTLVVWGAEDRLIEATAARKTSSQLPNARFVVLPACGHTPMEECPEAFLAAVLPFLVGGEPGAAGGIQGPAPAFCRAGS